MLIDTVGPFVRSENNHEYAVTIICDLTKYLVSVLSSNRLDWDRWLSFFTYCFNTTPSSAHGYCPYELIFGKNPEKLQFFSSGEVDPLYNIDAYDKEVRYRLQHANKRAQILLGRGKVNRKNLYDAGAKPQNIQVNDLVLLKKEPRHKLDPLYEGPYQVKSVCAPNCTLVNDRGKDYTVHMDRLKSFNSYYFDRFY